MSDYHCLVAGLPEVSMDEGKSPLTPTDFKTEILPLLTEKDRKIIRYFYLQWDNENLLTLLKNPDAGLERIGCYTADELRAFIAAAKEGNAALRDEPHYMHSFLSARFSSAENESQRIPDDLLSARFFEEAQHCENDFLSKWFTFNLNLNNILSALTARKYKLNTADYIIGDSEVCEALRTSGARDFGLSVALDYFEPLQRLSEMENLAERENRLDRLKWKWLDDNSAFYYFSVERLYLFLQKTQIADRWAKMNKATGEKVFEDMVDSLKKGIKIPEEFEVK